MYVPIVYGFLPEINVFVFVFVLPKVTENIFKKYMIIFEAINHLISLR